MIGRSVHGDRFRSVHGDREGHRAVLRWPPPLPDVQAGPSTHNLPYRLCRSVRGAVPGFALHSLCIFSYGNDKDSYGGYGKDSYGGYGKDTYGGYGNDSHLKPHGYGYGKSEYSRSYGNYETYGSK